MKGVAQMKYFASWIKNVTKDHICNIIGVIGCM